MAFLDDDFLLRTRTARELYGKYAEPEPILDYHCHLSPCEIAEDRKFENLFDLWISGDHYKWRAMRANGIEERFCTGDAPPYEKFFAWARTVPDTLRNPLYHWTHLELRRYFGIEELLNETTAPEIWRRANEKLSGGGLTARGILRKFHVTALCTTDDPADSLNHHAAIKASGFEIPVYPAFRPDRAFDVHVPEQWNGWLARLESVSNVDIRNLASLLAALEKRHDDFHALGARLSDHGLSRCPSGCCDEGAAESIFRKARGGAPATPEEQDAFAGFLMTFLARLDARKGWTKQLHLGALRNTNTRMREKLGPDTGFDSIGAFPQVESLARWMDNLERESSLPKMILYNVNPTENYAFATLAGNFQEGGIPAKVQYGSAWWFLDQKDGIELQLNALSNCGLLSRFVGMLTDSRSFMSFPRHEYFRRILCNLIGSEIENGELPDDADLLGSMIRGICYGNAQAYLGLPTAKGQGVS